MSSLVHPRKQAHQTQPRTVPDDGQIQQPIRLRRARSDEHAATVRAAVADSHERRVHRDDLVVEFDPVRQRLHLRQLGEHRQVVAHRSLGPRHPIGPFTDQRIESARDDRSRPDDGTVGQRDLRQVGLLHDAVGDHIGGCLGIACGNAELTGVIVTGARRDEPDRSIGQRGSLQSDADGTVTADHHQRVGTLLDRTTGQFLGVVGVGSDDLGDGNSPSAQSRNTFASCRRRVTMSRHRIDQDGNLLDLTAGFGHGISFPGLRMPAGSTAFFTARRMFAPSSPISSFIHGR